MGFRPGTWKPGEGPSEMEKPVRKGDMMQRQRTHKHDTRRSPLKGLAGGLLAGILFAACQGDNLFVDFTGAGGSGSVSRMGKFLLSGSWIHPQTK